MQRKEFENRIKNLLPKAADVWLILMLKSSKAAIIVARTAFSIIWRVNMV